MSGRAPHPAGSARVRVLLEGPIVPTLVRLAVPNVLNLVALTLIVTVDAFFVGRLGPDALAAVALVFPFKMVMQHIAASGMGGAVASAVARALGAGREDRARAVVLHAGVVCVAMAALFTAGLLAGGRAVYAALGGRGAALEQALAYSNVIFAGALAPWLFNTLANVIRGTGNMTLPAAAIAGCAVTDLALSPMLIFGFGPIPALGVTGAALGFVTSFAIGCAVLGAYLRLAAGFVVPSVRGGRLRKETFVEILKVGAPGAMNPVLSNATVVSLTALAASFGPAALAGYGIAARLEYVLIPLVFGLGTAMVTMVAANVGAGQIARAQRIAWVGAGVATGVTAAIGALAGAFPGLWMGLFTADGDVAGAGAGYLRMVGPFYGFAGLALGLYYASQGMGRVVWPVLANLGRFIVASAGGWIAVTYTERGPAGLAAVIAVSLTVYAAITAGAVKAGAWRLAGRRLAVIDVLGAKRPARPASPPGAAAPDEVAVRAATLVGEADWHRHDAEELVLVLRGRLRVRTPDDVREAGPGQLLVIPRQTDHRAAAVTHEVQVAVLEARRPV